MPFAPACTRGKNFEAAVQDLTLTEDHAHALPASAIATPSDYGYSTATARAARPDVCNGLAVACDGANLQRLCEDGELDMQAEVAGSGERVFIYFNGFIGRLSNTENTGSAYPTTH